MSMGKVAVRILYTYTKGKSEISNPPTPAGKPRETNSTPYNSSSSGEGKWMHLGLDRHDTIQYYVHGIINIDLQYKHKMLLLYHSPVSRIISQFQRTRSLILIL